MQRALQHLGVATIGTSACEKADAAGVGQLGHLGQRLALEAAGQRAEREHARHW